MPNRFRYTPTDQALWLQLRESELRFRQLAENIDAVFWIHEVDDDSVAYVSPACARILGMTETAICASPQAWQEVIHPDDRAGVAAAVEQHRQKARDADHYIEYRIVRRDGEVRWLRSRGFPIRDENGKVYRVGGVTEDITSARAARVQLEVTAGRLQQVLATSPVILAALRLEPGGRAVPFWVSENVFTILGYRPEDLTGNASWWSDGIHPDDRDAAMAASARIWSCDSNTHEYRFRSASGEWRWMHDDQRVISNNNGAREILVSWTDLTESRKSRTALEESELTHRTLYNSLTEMVCIMDFEGVVLDVNDAVAARTGYSRDELIGGVPHFLASMVDGDRERLLAHFTQAIQGEPQRGVRLTGCAKDGACFPAEVSFVRGRYFGKDAVIAVAQDITERRIAEDRLAAAESHYRRLVASSPYGIYAIDAEGQFTEINAAGLELLGRSYEDTIGASFASVVLPADLPAARDTLRRRLNGEIDTSETEIRVVRADGESRLLHIRASGIIEDGVVVGTHGVARDITAERRSAQQLRRAERLATVGTLIGGVAHELNNPLQAINNFAALLLEDAHTDEERSDLETIRREAERASRIVADLRLLARNTQDAIGSRAAIDVNDVVRHVIRTRRYSLESRNIVVVEDLARNLPPVWADASDMEQVLINLVVNAEQAMAEIKAERRLTVRTRASGEGVAIHVIDTGPGIPPHSLDLIFDPFYTTKPRAEGTGLGLSLVHKIVTEHEGRIHAESEVGRGATFHIHLPRASLSAQATGAATAGPRASSVRTAPSRPLRLLLIDDEPAIRSALSRFLTRRGHAVDTAGDGAEALRLLGDCAPLYDVILSDLRMPGISGDELLATLRERDCSCERRVMFLTGDAASGQAARILAASSAPVILKPIALSELASRVEQYADDAAAAAGCATRDADPTG